MCICVGQFLEVLMEDLRTALALQQLEKARKLVSKPIISHDVYVHIYMQSLYTYSPACNAPLHVTAHDHSL